MEAPLIPEHTALLIVRVLFAAGIGLLIGLERGWKQRGAQSGDRLAGIRTYAMYGLIGGLAGVAPGAWLLPAAVLGAAALIATGYFLSADHDHDDKGMTSEAAAIATVILGGLAGQGEMLVAAAGAVLVLLLLSLKEQLHRLLGLIRHDEIAAVVRLLALSVLILPFLPDRGYGPGGVLNPFQIWVAVLLVAALSFGGYIAIRIFGARHGPPAFGLLGGLASSTAVTVTSARLARADPALATPFAGAIGFASAVMMARVALLTFTFAPPLFAALWPALAAAALASVVAALALVWMAPKANGHDADLAMKVPDDLWFAVSFGAMLAAIGLGVHYGEMWFGDRGLYALAVLSGPLDVDAFSLSVARAAGHDASVAAAQAAVLLCVAVNTAGKVAIAAAFGSMALALRVAAVAAAAILAGFLAWGLA